MAGISARNLARSATEACIRPSESQASEFPFLTTLGTQFVRNFRDHILSMERDTDIQALLFDLGGVVIDIDFEQAITCWSTLSKMPAERVRERFTFDMDYERHERGEIDVHEYFDSLRCSLGLVLSDEQMLVGWNAIFVSEIAGIDDLLRRVSRRTQLYAFSNSNLAHQSIWEHDYSKVLRHFRTVFTSSALGARKPELGAFLAVCEAVKITPEQTLFFDDSPVNIRGASAAGMSAVLVRSIQDVEHALAEFGI